MAIMYTWKIIGIKTKNEGALNDAVVQTYWQKIGTDENGNVGTFSGATPFTTDGLDPEKFIEFSALTEELVLQWIQNVVVGSYEEHVNNQIQKQIDQKINSIKEQSLPWAAPIPETPA